MTEAPQPPATPAPTPPAASQGNGLAVAGMVLGIIGLAGGCLYGIGLAPAIVGLILSIMGKKKAKQTGVGGGMATAGIVCSVIALALAAVVLIGLIVGFSIFGAKVAEEMERMQQQQGQPAGQTMRLLLSRFA